MSQPFSRSLAMFAAIKAFVAAGLSQHQIVANLGEYKSRGKGKGKGQSSAHCVAIDRRAAAKRRNQIAHRKHCR